MKTIYDFCPVNLDELNVHFKPFCSWNPYYTSTKCWFDDWSKGDGGSLLVNNDHIELLCKPFKQPKIIRPGEPDELILTHHTSQLVGCSSIRSGRLTIDADLCLDDPDDNEFVKSFWFLSETRIETRKSHADYGKNTILPEWDAFETNTPNHKGEMSCSLINQYTPFKAHGVKKRSLVRYFGRQKFICAFKGLFVWTNFGGLTYRYPITEFYPILWVAVCGHQEARGMNARIRIYNLKMEEY